MKYSIIVILTLPLAACITPAPNEYAAPVEIKGTAQLSGEAPPPGCSTLVPIFAYDETEGRAKEDAWVVRNHPGATVTGRETMSCSGTPVDRVSFTMADGTPTSVLFDITSFNGRQEGDY